MSIIANLFGWFRMSENSNTQAANNSTNEYPHLMPTLGYAHDSRPRINTTSGWAVTSRDLTGNLSTNYYSDNDVWSMPAVTGRDASDAINEYLSNRLREDSLWPGTNKKLKHFDAFRDSASELSKKQVNLSADEINKFSNIIATYSALQLPAEEKAKVLQWLANVVEHCSHSTEEPEDDNSVDL